MANQTKNEKNNFFQLKESKAVNETKNLFLCTNLIKIQSIMKLNTNGNMANEINSLLLNPNKDGFVITLASKTPLDNIKYSNGIAPRICPPITEAKTPNKYRCPLLRPSFLAC